MLTYTFVTKIAVICCKQQIGKKSKHYLNYNLSLKISFWVFFFCLLIIFHRSHFFLHSSVFCSFFSLDSFYCHLYYERKRMDLFQLTCHIYRTVKLLITLTYCYNMHKCSHCYNMHQ